MLAILRRKKNKGWDTPILYERPNGYFPLFLVVPEY